MAFQGGRFAVQLHRPLSQIIQLPTQSHRLPSLRRGTSASTMRRRSASGNSHARLTTSPTAILDMNPMLLLCPVEALTRFGRVRINDGQCPAGRGERGQRDPIYQIRGNVDRAWHSDFDVKRETGALG